MNMPFISKEITVLGNETLSSLYDSLFVNCEYLQRIWNIVMGLKTLASQINLLKYQCGIQFWIW